MRLLRLLCQINQSSLNPNITDNVLIRIFKAFTKILKFIDDQLLAVSLQDVRILFFC